MSYKEKGLSKFLAYVLRHHAKDFNLTISPEGWVSVE